MKSPLEMAIAGFDLQFVAHSSCQSLITKLWYGVIMPDTGLITVNKIFRQCFKYFKTFLILDSFNRFFCPSCVHYLRLFQLILVRNKTIMISLNWTTTRLVWSRSNQKQEFSRKFIIFASHPTSSMCTICCRICYFQVYSATCFYANSIR